MNPSFSLYFRWVKRRPIRSLCFVQSGEIHANAVRLASPSALTTIAASYPTALYEFDGLDLIQGLRCKQSLMRKRDACRVGRAAVIG
jgi:hypothetical protein